MNEIFNDIKAAITEHGYEKFGIESLIEGIKDEPDETFIKKINEKYKNCTEEFKNFKTSIIKIQVNLEILEKTLGSDLLFDKQEDLVEFGRVIKEEADKLIAIGKGASK